MDLFSQGTQIFLNPRWSADEKKILRELSEKFSLKNHFWVASSGSSAEKMSSVKLVALSHAAILASAEAVNKHLQATAQDRWAQCLPEFHVGGIGVEARASLTGAKVYSGLRPGDQGKWDPRYCHQILSENKITLTAMVPAQIFDLVQLNLEAPPSLRAVVIGGASLAQDLYKKAISLGWVLLPSFGMTECCSQIATAELESWKKKKRDMKILGHVKARLTPKGFLQIQSP